MKQSPGPHGWPRTWQRFLLLFLGLVNLWSGSVTYKHHLLASLANWAVAAVLLILVVATWQRKGGRPPC